MRPNEDFGNLFLFLSSYLLFTVVLNSDTNLPRSPVTGRFPLDIIRSLAASVWLRQPAPDDVSLLPL